MERGRRNEREGSAMKTTLVVLGGLALSWLTMETAFKPYLDRIRGSINRSDPTRDPDSDGDDAAAEAPKGDSSKESDWISAIGETSILIPLFRLVVARLGFRSVGVCPQLLNWMLNCPYAFQVSVELKPKWWKSCRIRPILVMIYHFSFFEFSFLDWFCYWLDFVTVFC